MSVSPFYTRLLSTLSLALLMVVLAACENTQPAETPAEDTADATEEMADEATMPSIVEIALADENFSTLVAALQAGELVETLQGEGPFTVFAPTNAAFEALPEGTLESLLQPENKDQLVGILTYHVVSGKAMAADVVGMSEAATIQGAAVPIAVDGETVNVGEATVVTADVEASNGVIHVIDTVLLPPSDM